MFVRSELKSQAKAIMRSKYFQMVLVCLIASFLTVSMLDISIDTEEKRAVMTLFGRVSQSVNYQKALMMAGPVAIVGLLWNFFVINPATVGINCYFKHCTYNEESFDDLWSGFKYNYGHNVKVMAIMELKVALWTLLLIVPGVMKAYSYYFVPYLLSDYPDLEADEILKMSEKMAVGIRFDIFVLGLSFILWHFLVAFTAFLTLGFGATLLQPYINQTVAQLYHWAKENRLEVNKESEFVYGDESNIL